MSQLCFPRHGGAKLSERNTSDVANSLLRDADEAGDELLA